MHHLLHGLQHPHTDVVLLFSNREKGMHIFTSAAAVMKKAQDAREPAGKWIP